LPADVVPDPKALLDRVVEARRQIRSGEMVLDVAWFFEAWLPLFPLATTNTFQLEVTFDGNRCRVVKSGREYFSVFNSELVVDKRRELGLLDPEAAAKAGLLMGRDSREVNIFDGNEMLH